MWVGELYTSNFILIHAEKCCVVITPKVSTGENLGSNLSYPGEIFVCFASPSKPVWG